MNFLKSSNFFSSFLLILILLLFMGQAWALSTDREQPINIEADRLDVDDAKGFGVYRGNVVLTQGSARLNADVIRVYSNAQRELIRVEAMGKPAKFRQLMDETREEVTGQALEIIYRVSEEYVVLKGRAYFWKCGDEFSGNRIEYFAPQALVKASQSKQGNERVNVTLLPQSKKGENNSSTCMSRLTSPSATQRK
ncbi:MAG: lipopolysaccharide transport periplasmic protein LptA [Gammaproteobacteria bacterium]|nr:lipopolysaccharide transport periplasmic protein LptA [Gammaproteobacteria bacterium]